MHAALEEQVPSDIHGEDDAWNLLFACEEVHVRDR